MADEVSSTPPARRPGGRSARVRRQVLEAVEADLVEHGFAALTVDSVAARAGVHRATVFRRWHDVGGLLADLFDAAGTDDWQPGDHGSLVADLAALGVEVVDGIGPASVSRALIAAAGQSPPAAVALHRFLESRYDRCAPVIDRARVRGELPASVDDAGVRRLLVLATAPIYHLVLHLGQTPDRAEVEIYARAAVAAITGDGDWFERLEDHDAARSDSPKGERCGTSR